MNKRTKITVISIVTILVLSGGVYYYWHNRQLKSDAATTSTSESAQNEYKGDDRHSEDGQSDQTQQGGAVDNNGDTTTTPSADTPVTSASGIIAITGPSANSTVTSGSTALRGTAKDLTEVQYRLIDDAAGVIGQGTLKVVNGTYSGTLQFTPQASTGRIDVYSFNSNYQEQNNVQIPVKFKR